MNYFLKAKFQLNYLTFVSMYGNKFNLKNLKALRLEQSSLQDSLADNIEALDWR